jgi:hypothetical protein
MKKANLNAKLVVFIVLSIMLLSACDSSLLGMVFSGEMNEPDEEVQAEGNVIPSDTPTVTPRPIQPSHSSDHTPTPTSTPTPTAEPEVLNPFTGLPVQDPNTLCNRPLLVSVSNFPITARPQSGLSLASQVWETFIGEGMTRFLVLFYGDYIAHLQEILSNRLAEGYFDIFVIGPIRSARVVFEDIKTLFPRSRLVTAGASSEIADQLSNQSSIFGSDPDDINSAGIGVEDLEEEPGCLIDPEIYYTLAFDNMPPPGGVPADSLRILYNYYNRVGWTYDPASGAYLRSQDKADGTGELYPATDKLTGEQLAFENVVVMWAQHRYAAETIIEMELVYVWDRKGLLLRDGKLYEIKWTTRSGKFTIHDAEGNPIPLKPGATFFEVVSWQSSWDPEAMEVRYHNPPRP